MAGAVTKSVDLIVGSDRLTAAISVAQTADPKTITREAVNDLLADKRIALREDVRKRVETFLAACAGGKPPAEPFPVAVGQAARHGRNASLQWAEGYDPDGTTQPEQDGQVDFYNRHNYVIANEGDSLLTIQPATRGEDGLDVYGNTVKARPGKPLPISAGTHVSRSEDRLQFHSTASGRVLFDGHTLAINPVLEVRGDVDFQSGNVDFAGDVKISKGVLDRFRVRAGGNLEVGGLVEGAILEVAGNTVLLRGAMMKEKGYIHAHGNLAAKILSNTFICCRGNVEIAKEVMNCTILCFGAVRVQYGTLAGGLVIGRGGLWVETLGSVTAKTVVVAGHDPTAEPELQELAKKAEKLTDSAEKVRNTVKPLLAMGKRLSTEHREKCTELLFQADTIDGDAKKCEERREQIHEQLREFCVKEVHVSKIVYADTIVRIGEDYCRIPKELHGPLKLIVSRENHVSLITAVWPDGLRKSFEKTLTPEERKLITDLPTGLPDPPVEDAPAEPSDPAGS